MEKNKLPNDNEINNEKQTLQQEVKRLDIYKNCNNYELDKFLCYFPNKATEIRECFCKEEGKNVLQPEKKEQLQEIIMDELCSLLYPCIEKGYKVLQLNGSFYWGNTCECLIYLNAPENDTNIGISLGNGSKVVSTNAYFRDENDNGQLKPRFFPKSGIQINHNYKDNKFHNEIQIFDYDMDYTLIIYPDTKDIKLTDYREEIPYTTFCDQSNEIFKDKDEIIPFFSTLSFTEIEQVLQVLNKHLKDKNYFKVDIGTVLNEIKNTIEKNRKEEKKNEENSISKNEIIIKKSNENTENVLNIDEKRNDKKKNEENNIIKNELINEKSNTNIGPVLNEIKDKIDEKRDENNNNEQKEDNDSNSEEKKIDTKQKPKIEKEDGIYCKCCITCLKQCWSHNERER